MSSVPVKKTVSRTWLSGLAIAVLANTYLWGFGFGGILGGSVPVVLTHGPSSIRVAENTTMLDVIKSCPSLYGEKATYKTPWWLPTGNMQTLWNAIGDFTQTDVIPYERRYLRVPDNGTLVLDAYPPLDETPADTPIVVILHGITGSSQEAYSRSTVGALSRSKADGGPGYRTIVLNFRGCDGTPVTSSRLYHAGETDDFRSVLLYLTHKYPDAPLFAVGFSMGASTLAVYLGEQGENTPLKGAVCVSNPWDWTAARHWIENGSLMNRWVYGPVLADALRTIFRRNLHAFPDGDPRLKPTEVAAVLAKQWFTIGWYDDRITAPLFGFKDADDYYTQTSSKQHMPNIRIPLLNLLSTDDPIVDDSYLPWAEVNSTDSIVFASTHGGGHVGWFEVDPASPKHLKRWYTTPVAEFFQGLLQAEPSAKKDLAPPMSVPDENGLISQLDLPVGRVGFIPVAGEAFLLGSTDTGRSIQGF